MSVHFTCRQCGGRWPVGNIVERFDEDQNSYHLCENCDQQSENEAFAYGAVLVGVDTDGSSIWRDGDEVYNSGDELTNDEAEELTVSGWDGKTMPWVMTSQDPAAQ